jgi:hypothetical protein
VFLFVPLFKSSSHKNVYHLKNVNQDGPMVVGGNDAMVRDDAVVLANLFCVW